MNTKAVVVVTIAVALWAGATAFADRSCNPIKEIKIWGGLSSKPKTAQAYKPKTVRIGVGDFNMFTMNGPAAGYTLSEREVVVYNRLIDVLSKGPVTPDAVCVGKIRSAPTIFVGPYRLVSVYASDARSAGMTQQRLAEKWRDGIAGILPKVAVAALAKPAGPAFLPPPVTGQAAGKAGVYDVSTGGSLLFRLRDKDGFASVQARGQAVEAHLVKVLSDGKAVPHQAVARVKDGQWAVMWDDVKVVDITTADAALNCKTPEALASYWAQRLNAALAKARDGAAK